jgi:hypothetical protein
VSGDDEQQGHGTSGDRFPNMGRYQRHRVEDLLAMPAGDARLFDLGGVLLSLVAAGDGTFRVLSRSGVPAHVLAGHRSAKRVRRE